MDRNLVVNGREFSVRRTGTSGQRATARVRGNVITIRIPVSWPREEGFKASVELERKVIADLEKNPQKSGEPKMAFTHGQEVSLFGRTFKIVAEPGSAKASRARLVGDEVKIALAAGLGGEKAGEHVSNLARRVISRSVKQKVEERVRALNEKHFNFPMRRIFLKDTASRWGSCSQDGNINLNFALLFAPGEVMDSVIIHELAHLKEQNHGPAFRALVNNAMPDYAERRKWLDENAGRLGANPQQDAD